MLAPLQPNLHFLLDDLAALPATRLRARAATPQAILTLLALQFVRDAVEADPVVFAERWLPLWRALWADPAGRFGLMALFSYLAAHLRAPEERLAVAVARIQDEDETMAKTIEQLLERGRAEMLLRQIRTRFGGVSSDVERRVRAADIDTLDHRAERILTAASLEELFD